MSNLVKRLKKASGVYHLTPDSDLLEEAAVVVAELKAEVAELEAEVAELEGVLMHNGFERCDIRVCNCGSWHQTAARRRRAEVTTPQICPECNIEKGDPHYCRPDWSGPSLSGKVEEG